MCTKTVNSHISFVFWTSVGVNIYIFSFVFHLSFAYWFALARMLIQVPELCYTLHAKTIRATAKKSAVKKKYLCGKRKIWLVSGCSFNLRRSSHAAFSQERKRPFCHFPMRTQNPPPLCYSTPPQATFPPSSLQMTLFFRKHYFAPWNGHQHVDVARK